jgi:pimeloyl-ACP methyl ester carboxylesterase
MVLVDVGGYRLAVQLDGGPEDANVVFVSGKDEGREAWSQVLPLLRRPVRTLLYDRGGIGDSDARPGGSPVSYRVLADELHHLLGALGVTGPSVVVGHSLGGLIARAFIAGYPQQVSGLVMVDTAVPHARLWPDPSPYTDGERPDSSVIDLDTSAARLPAPTASVPAVVLTKAPGAWGSPEASAEVDAYWQRTQRELAAALGAVQIIALNAGHRLNEETPRLVAMAVDAVVHAATTATAPAFEPAGVLAAGGRMPTRPGHGPDGDPAV